MRPDQIDLLLTPSAPTLHPGGEWAVVSVVRPDVAKNDYLGQLWAVPVGDGKPSRFTRGHRDTAPRFSPDGQRLAFLRAGAGGAKPQLHVMPSAGGEAVQLTDATLGAGEPHWSPDGSRIAYVARSPEPGRYGTDEQIDADAEPPRLITDLRYLSDGVGYSQDRRSQVYVIDVPDLQADPAGVKVARDLSPVTSGPFDVDAVAWSPDGDRLAIVSARHEGRTGDLRADVWTCTPEGTDLVPVTPTTLHPESVRWSTDGARLWFLASDPGPTGLSFVAEHLGLFSVPADGSAAPVRHAGRDHGPGGGRVAADGHR